MSRSSTFEARVRRPSAAARTPRRAAETTPLFTRHMVGVIELERDERGRRRAAIRDGTNSYEPVARVVAASIAPALAAEPPFR